MSQDKILDLVFNMSYPRSSIQYVVPGYHADLYYPISITLYTQILASVSSEDSDKDVLLAQSAARLLSMSENICSKPARGLNAFHFFLPLRPCPARLPHRSPDTAARYCMLPCTTKNWQKRRVYQNRTHCLQSATPTRYPLRQ